MRFVIVSTNDICRITKMLRSFDFELDDREPDFVITYGGDGTILASERKFPGVPKITVRHSERGFKCMYNDSDLEYVLAKIKNQNYEIIEEMKLETYICRYMGPEGRGECVGYEGYERYLSLNETQIHNPIPIKTVRFSIYTINIHPQIIEGPPIFGRRVIGDGVVVATPFGSSAYYSSLGGKEFKKGIGVALNNPHGMIDNGECDSGIRRCMVVRDDSTIYIKMDRDDGLLIFDNDPNMITLKEGDEVIIKKSSDVARFVRIT